MLTVDFRLPCNAYMLRRLTCYVVFAKKVCSLGNMEFARDFKAFQARVTSTLVNVTKTAGQVSAEDLGFHRSLSSKLSKSLDAQNARLLQLTNKLLKAATKDGNIIPPKLHSHEDVEDQWRNAVDVIDDLLEKSDACLDEFTGVIKRLSPAPQDGAAIQPRPQKRPQNVVSVFQHTTLPKPQLLFERAVANDQVAPFKPLLRSKPHPILPLEESIGSGEEKGCVEGVQPLQHSLCTDIKQVQAPLWC